MVNLKVNVMTFQKAGKKIKGLNVVKKMVWSVQCHVLWILDGIPRLNIARNSKNDIHALRHLYILSNIYYTQKILQSFS
jgi:hypothetical protein